jgi:hypothetical protein
MLYKTRLVLSYKPKGLTTAEKSANSESAKQMFSDQQQELHSGMKPGGEFHINNVTDIITCNRNEWWEHVEKIKIVSQRGL